MDNSSELFLQVKEYLLSKAPSPGERIETEQSLAARFGVTRYRIRQVLGTLSQLGLIDRSPRRGSVLCGFDAESLSSQIKFQFEVAGFDISEFTEARSVVECAMMPLVVRRITPSQISKLKSNILKMEEFAGQPEEADKYDLNFHLLLLEASGNRALNAFSGVIVSLFKDSTYRGQFHSREYILNTIVKEHWGILEAIRQSDVEKAVSSLRDHLLVQ